MIDELPASPVRGFLFPALLLAGVIFAVALALLPFALHRADSGGPLGLLTAAAICLAAGWVAEGLAFTLQRQVAPVGVMLLGMAIRMTPPLGICLFLAAQGQSGRQHLAFICYLLLFYLATLAIETWLAVKRISHASSQLNPSAH
jgi:hypothetical protein